MYYYTYNILVIALLAIQQLLGVVSGQQNGEVTDTLKPLQGRSSSTNTSLINKVQYFDANGHPVLVQFTYTGPPKILPISTADSYPEGSSINLICTVSGGQRRGLVLSWQINNENIDEQKLRYSESLTNVVIDTVDVDISRLKITNATSINSAQYTCNAKNPLGQDSTSVKITING